MAETDGYETMREQAGTALDDPERDSDYPMMTGDGRLSLFGWRLVAGGEER